jgi:hypothetical protein
MIFKLSPLKLEKINVALKLWLSAGAFVALTTHLVHLYGDVLIAGEGLQI